jgi:hypothetical protein
MKKKHSKIEVVKAFMELTQEFELADPEII